MTKEFNVTKKRKIQTEAVEISLELIKYPKQWKGKTEFKLDLSSNKKTFLLGNEKDKCDIFLDKDDSVDPVHCSFTYDEEKKCWFIRNGEDPLYGTYISCKNKQELDDVKTKYDEFKEVSRNLGSSGMSEKSYCPSKPQRLQKGMQIFLCYHILEVV